MKTFYEVLLEMQQQNMSGTMSGPISRKDFAEIDHLLLHPISSGIDNDPKLTNEEIGALRKIKILSNKARLTLTSNNAINIEEIKELLKEMETAQAGPLKRIAGYIDKDRGYLYEKLLPYMSGNKPLTNNMGANNL